MRSLRVRLMRSVEGRRRGVPGATAVCQGAAVALTIAEVSRGRVIGFPGESTNPDPTATEDHNRTLVEIVDQIREVCEKQLCLIRRTSWGAMPEENHRRLRTLAERQQRSEIGIGREDDTAFVEGGLQDDRISGEVQPPASDVNGIMAAAPQVVGDFRRQRVVDEELHRGESRGSSRSRTASAAKCSA
jgi:hypothetical protein